MSQPSILIVTNRVPYPLNDGGNLAMFNMVKGYSEAGWKVFLFSMNTTRHFIAKEKLPKLFHEIGFETFDIDTEVTPIGVLKNLLFSKLPNHAQRFYNKDFENKLGDIIQHFQPDVVQLESVFLATYFKEIRRQRKAILAIRLHNIEYRIWKGLAEESRHLFKKYYLQNLATRMKRFEQNAWQEADVIIPITQRDAEIAKANISRTKIMVAPFGMNEKIVKSNVEEQWNAYHIGAMDWAPNAEGIRWLIEEAWKDIHDAVPELQFHFAGRNMPVDFKNYEDNGVVCEGEVADANTFIANKKILLVPLFAAGGIRVKVLEGMAAGKLVIATPTAMQGIDEAVSGKHFLLATNAEEFKQQILWTLHHKEEATQIAEQGKKLVEEYYNQEKIMKKLSDFLLQQINTSTTHL